MCERETMTEPMSSVQISQPPAASGLNSASSQLKAGRFVVNPQNIKPYSFYDELKKGDNYFNEALQVVASKKLPSDKTKNNKKTFKKFLTAALTAGLAVWAFAKRKDIVKFFKNLKK